MTAGATVEVAAEVTVDDPARVAHLHAHLEALAVAARAGADVRAWFTRALVDEDGEPVRYGLVRADLSDRHRRRSYDAYREAVRQAGRAPVPPPR